MFAAALVAADDALDVLHVLIALSSERDERAAGLRAGRARRGALLGLLVQVVSAAAGRVAPRRRHQGHGPAEPAEIVVVPAAGLQRLERHAVRRPALVRRRCGRTSDRAADARHARATAAARHRA